MNSHHVRIVEAVLFASRDPVSVEKLAAFLPSGSDVESLIQTLRDDYAHRGVQLVFHGGGWAFRTAPDLAAHLRTEQREVRRLSRAAVEVLAIIAYHQPVTRAEIEDMRGVSLSKGTLDALMEAGWVAPRGRRKVPGRPLQWGTTPEFLSHFALDSLESLPSVKELKAAGLLDIRPNAGAYGNRAGEDVPPVDADDEPLTGEADEEADEEV